MLMFRSLNWLLVVGLLTHSCWVIFRFLALFSVDKQRDQDCRDFLIQWWPITRFYAGLCTCHWLFDPPLSGISLTLCVCCLRYQNHFDGVVSKRQLCAVAVTAAVCDWSRSLQRESVLSSSDWYPGCYYDCLVNCIVGISSAPQCELECDTATQTLQCRQQDTDLPANQPLDSGT